MVAGSLQAGRGLLSPGLCAPDIMPLVAMAPGVSIGPLQILLEVERQAVLP